VQAKTTAKFATLKLASETAALESPSGLGMVKKTSLEHKAPHSLDSCQYEGVRGIWGIPQALRVLRVGLPLRQASNPSSGKSGDHLRVSRLDLEIKPGLRDEPIVV
jgi:hypothetical protein